MKGGLSRPDSSPESIIIFFIYFVYFLFGGLIIWFEVSSESEKSMAISFFLYFGLVTLNIVVGFLAKFDKKPEHKHYFRAALYLTLAVCLLDLLAGYIQMGSFFP